LRSVGAVPWVIPLAPDDPDTLAEIAARIDGLFLTGGADVEPGRYGETRHVACGVHDPDRDATELTLLKLAAERGLPVFGICRGLQVMNVAAGGTLYQDIGSQVPAALKHDNPPARDALVHEITVAPGCRLAGLLGETVVGVNSLHHQAVKDLGTGLRPSAYSPDGVIEGVEGTDGRFVVGVQWHPEELTEAHPGMRRLFAAFVEASGTG
jgi:putative glutamine amidotransferase